MLRCGQQREAVERIEKETGVTLLVQQLGLRIKMLAPGRLRQVHHLAVPYLVSHCAGGGLQQMRKGVGLILVKLADGQVGKGQRTLSNEQSDIRSLQVRGFNNYPIEMGKFGQGGAGGIPESDTTGCTGLRHGRAEKRGKHEQNGSQHARRRAGVLQDGSVPSYQPAHFSSR